MAEKVLVIGPLAEVDASALSTAPVEQVFTFALDSQAAISESPLALDRVIDVTGRSLAIEREAWEWTRTLIEAVAQRVPGLDPGVLAVLRRQLFMHVMRPVATARARAQRLAESRPADAQVLYRGMPPVDEAAIRARFVDAAREECRPAARAESAATAPNARRARSGRLSRVLRRQADFWRLRSRLRSELGAVRSGAPGRIALVVASVDSHMQLLKSTLDELESRGWIFVLVIASNADSPSKEHLSRFRAVIPLANLIERVPFARVARRLRRQSAIRDTVHAWAAGKGLTEHADWIAVHVVGSYFGAVGQRVEAFGRVLDWLRPAVVITASETGAAEAVVPAARSVGVPTVNVQHGVISDSPIRSDFEFDAFCVFGEGYAETLEALGTSRSRIRVVGNPLLDGRDVHAMAPSRQALEGGDVLRITFAAQHNRHHISDYALYRTLAPVLEHVAADPLCSLTVKLHPLGLGGEFGYELALRQYSGLRVHQERERSIADVLTESDCVVVYSSTVGFDAMEMGIPVIVMNPFLDEGGALAVAGVTDLHAHDAASFGACVRALRDGYEVSDERRRALRERYFFGEDGLAGKRIADICEELAS